MVGVGQRSTTCAHRVLSEAQLEVARIVAALPEAEEFALAGGAALIVQGKVDRETRDLDFFGLDPESVNRLLPAAEQALRKEGFDVSRVVESSGYARLLVVGLHGVTELDLAADARILPTVAGPGFRVLSGAELAADKVLAIFGRAEARDFVDLMAVERHFGIQHLFDLALDKDPGFRPVVFAEMLDRFGRLRREEFPLSDNDYSELLWQTRVWRSAAMEYARSSGLINEEERARTASRQKDHGMGL